MTAAIEAWQRQDGRGLLADHVDEGFEVLGAAAWRS